AKGQTEQLTAIATYSDNTSSDVSDSVAWLVDNTDTATVTQSGLLAGVDVGTTSVTATKDDVTSNWVNIDVLAAVITDITVTPATVVGLIKGQAVQLIAMATYSDNTTLNVINSMTWNLDDCCTVTVTSDGLLKGVGGGDTTLTGQKDGIVSNLVAVNVCTYGDACIDVFDTGGGKLFTSSPSVAYLNSIGGGATDGVYTEDGSFGPIGEFYLFKFASAFFLCSSTYNAQNVGGRSNWRLATKDELKVELYNKYGSMYISRGWPVTHNYWSSSFDPANIFNYFVVHLSQGVVGSYPESGLLPLSFSASCVSEP
ncbi:Ig-like domain-containing protein, partial [Vibrio cyclitrophicus]